MGRGKPLTLAAEATGCKPVTGRTEFADRTDPNFKPLPCVEDYTNLSVNHKGGSFGVWGFISCLLYKNDVVDMVIL